MEFFRVEPSGRKLELDPSKPVECFTRLVDLWAFVFGWHNENCDVFALQGDPASEISIHSYQTDVAESGNEDSLKYISVAFTKVPVIWVLEKGRKRIGRVEVSEILTTCDEENDTREIQYSFIEEE